MAFVYTIFIIAVIVFIFYRISKKKSTPSNRYTPYDNITMGTNGSQENTPIHDTKHHVPFEEKSTNAKNE
ncbi:DUF3951 domain-containing protein [Falsibacillus pallidus]|uniref:Uncharacterized protein DUF3951 n=1 Tax=Falsibacillus pallidus TaxID=493781 RepID=A0A370G011_9BACI|nr:DUF3951 domain-containing protein [Falsibacillus pallidus]RDI37221.1 uncharacterized protein DUF3951 [Falsibacillus pallidus]